MHKLYSALLGIFVALATPGYSQSLGNAATLTGTVTDQTDAVVPNAVVHLRNPISKYERSTVTDQYGAFRFVNVPQNQYHVEVSAPGFDVQEQDANLRTSVPVVLAVKLALAGGKTEMTVEAAGADLLETVSYSHNDIDKSLTDSLPTASPGSGLSDAITMGTPGVVADSNGFFHPQGDHAQVTFSVDGQTVSDQQSKQFSTQLPLNAVQSMQVISGAPPAEYGDKTSLVVNTTTRSGLGEARPTGSLTTEYGSFGTINQEAAIGFGGKNWGSFTAANGLRSGRFLDTPEFQPVHAVGNSGNIFQRFDYQPTQRDVFHLNLLLARNWFQIPNTYDQAAVGQDQHQQVRTFSVAPGYQRTLGASLLYTVNAWYREDFVNYTPSANPFSDTPGTIAQLRKLRSTGVKSDLAISKRRHAIKMGVQYSQTGLSEDTRFALTSAAANPVCLTGSGAAVPGAAIASPDGCSAAGYLPNGSFVAGLLPIDLSRGGSYLNFRGRGTINQTAVFAQDEITLGDFNLSLGLRFDDYRGLSSDSSWQPRVGLAYHFKPTGTVLRASYSRTMETPYNENLLLSSSTGLGGQSVGQIGAYGDKALKPGIRSQYNVGLQQAFDKKLLIDGEYFWKFTDNAYDFDTLFNTPIVFPISWNKSKIDGVSLRLSTPDIHGFTAYVVMGHTRARVFGPENGGLLFNSPLATSVFRIDHDQAFQHTAHARYQFKKKGPWVAFTWRYDSGMVAGAVQMLDDALALTAAEQTAIGFYCGVQRATLTSPITACSSSNYGATRLVIPKAGTANDDHNPPRVAPRNLFDAGIGIDDILGREHYKLGLRFNAENLTNEVSLYNFLSTFSGTHFVAPRNYQAAVILTF
jgi:outer membrane cobalamin receptor